MFYTKASTGFYDLVQLKTLLFLNGLQTDHDFLRYLLSDS